LLDPHLELPTSRSGTSVSEKCPGGLDAAVLGTSPTWGLYFLVLMERNLAKGQTLARASLPVPISFIAFWVLASWRGKPSITGLVCPSHKDAQMY